MGIRPVKTIGWGTTVKGSALNEIFLDSHHKEMAYLNSLSLKEYCERDDLIKNSNLISRALKEKSDSGHAKIIKSLFRIIYPSYEYELEENYINDNFLILFTPMVDYKIYQGLFENPPFADDGLYSSREESFLYAEIEKLCPETFSTLEPYSYQFKRPIFPDSYSVVDKETGSIADINGNTYSFIQDALLGNLLKGSGDPADSTERLEFLAQMADFASFSELTDKYQLAPPSHLIRFAQWVSIFKDARSVLTLKPTVAYEWR